MDEVSETDVGGGVPEKLIKFCSDIIMHRLVILNELLFILKYLEAVAFPYLLKFYY